MIRISGPCDENGCPEGEVHANAAGQMELLAYAANQLHSLSFLDRIANSESEIATDSRLRCALAWATHVGSWVSIAGCSTGVGCVVWIALHTASGYGVASACAEW
jgi:hypothetical protein